MLTDEIRVYAPPELKRLVGEAADAADLPMTEWVVQVLAARLGRPDLAVIPRRWRGRKRKTQAAMPATNCPETL